MYSDVRYARPAGKRVIVTGGASGIGSAMIEAFAARGSRVVFLDANRDAAALVVRVPDAAFRPCDLADTAAPRAMLAAVGRASYGARMALVPGSSQAAECTGANFLVGAGLMLN